MVEKEKNQQVRNLFNDDFRGIIIFDIIFRIMVHFNMIQKVAEMVICIICMAYVIVINNIFSEIIVAVNVVLDRVFGHKISVCF